MKAFMKPFPCEKNATVTFVNWSITDTQYYISFRGPTERFPMCVQQQIVTAIILSPCTMGTVLFSYSLCRTWHLRGSFILHAELHTSPSPSLVRGVAEAFLGASSPPSASLPRSPSRPPPLTPPPARVSISLTLSLSILSLNFYFRCLSTCCLYYSLSHIHRYSRELCLTFNAAV